MKSVSSNPLRRSRRRAERRGAILLLVVASVLFLLIFASFVVNLAYMQLTDTELRSATDAATRAAAEALMRGGDLTDAREAARRVAAENFVGGQPLQLRDEDVIFGRVYTEDSGRVTFLAHQEPINAVRVLGLRTEDSSSGRVGLLFQGLLSTTHFEAVRTATARIQDRDFCLVLDHSGSMNSRDAISGQRGQKMSRIEALKIATQAFVDVLDETRGSERLGAVSYSNFSQIDARLDQDYSPILQVVNLLQARGMTNIGAGIDDAVEVLTDTSNGRIAAQPIMVVMTDGRHNQSRDPLDAARDALWLLPNLEIHTVTFSVHADQQRMIELAQVGRGQHHHANDLDELTDVFREIARTAGTSLVE